MKTTVEHLPEDLVDVIVNRLGMHDLLRLGYTCKTFYSLLRDYCPLLKFPNHLPWLIVPAKNSPSNRMAFDNKDSVGFFSLCDEKIHPTEIPQLSNRRICGSFAGGWLMTVHENSEVQLFNPFSTKSSNGKPEIHLPPCTCFPRMLEMTTVESKEEDNDHKSLTLFYHGKRIGGQDFRWDSKRMRDTYIQKVAMSSSSPSKGAVIMAIHGPENTLAYYTIGGDQCVWSPITGGNMCHFNDVTFYKGNFYAAHKNGYIVVIKGLEKQGTIPYGKIIKYEPSSTNYIMISRNYIVVSGDDLLVVVRSGREGRPYRTPGFQVLKLKFGTSKEWEEVKSLGNRAVFVGSNSSFSLSSTDFSGCKPNSIYFTDDVGQYCLKTFGCGGHDFGIFNLEDGCVDKFLYPSDTCIVMPPPIWFTPSQPFINDRATDSLEEEDWYIRPFKRFKIT